MRLTPILLLASLLAGCATDSTAVAPSIALACNTYAKQNTFDSTRDTAETIRGIKVKQRAFENIGCDVDRGGVKQ